MSAREKIFSGIRKALEHLPARAMRPDVPLGVADAKWLASEPDITALFKKRAEAAGTICFTSPSALLSWIVELQPRTVFVQEEFKGIFAELAPSFELVTDYSRERIDEIDVAITAAQSAIAESGTIVLTDRTTPDRLAALGPWTHIAVVRKETIRRSIADALANMPDDPNVIWVTGPSKTADVEGILIQGVHGPGVQGCLLV